MNGSANQNRKPEWNGERRSSDGRVEAGHHPRRCCTFAWELLLVTMTTMRTTTGSNEHWMDGEIDSVKRVKKWRWGRRQSAEGDELVGDSKTGEGCERFLTKPERKEGQVKAELLKRKGRELAVVMQARNQREEGREEMNPSARRKRNG